MRRALFVIAALVLACSGGEKERQLQMRADALEAERTHLSGVAMDMLAVRHETEKLNRELATAQESSLNPQYFREGVESTGEHATLSWEGEQATFSGKGGAAGVQELIDRATVRLPAAGLSHLTIASDGAWKVRVFRIVPPPEAAAPATAAPAASPTPARGGFENAHVARLREQIERLDLENAELRKIADESDALGRRRVGLEAEVQSLERADRIVNASSVLDLLLDAKSGAFREGEILFDRDRLRVNGVLGKGAPRELLLLALGKHFAIRENDAKPPAIDLELSRLSTN